MAGGGDDGTPCPAEGTGMDACPQEDSQEAAPGMFADAVMDEDAPDAVPASGETAGIQRDLSSLLRADDAPSGDLRA